MTSTPASPSLVASAQNKNKQISFQLYRHLIKRLRPSLRKSENRLFLLGAALFSLFAPAEVALPQLDVTAKEVAERFIQDTRYQFIHADVDGNGVEDLVIYDADTAKFAVRLYGRFQVGHPYYRANNGPGKISPGCEYPKPNITGNVDYCDMRNRPLENWGDLHSIIGNAHGKIHVGYVNQNGTRKAQLIFQIATGAVDQRLFFWVLDTVKYQDAQSANFNGGWRFKFRFRSFAVPVPASAKLKYEVTYANWKKPILADFNNDGASDFLGLTALTPASGNSGIHRFWLALTHTSPSGEIDGFTLSDLQVTEPLPRDVVVGDLNKDGLSDLVVYYRTNNWTRFFASYGSCAAGHLDPLKKSCSAPYYSSTSLFKLVEAAAGSYYSDIQIGDFTNNAAQSSIAVRENDNDYKILHLPANLDRWERADNSRHIFSRWECPWRPDSRDAAVENAACLKTTYASDPAFSGKIITLAAPVSLGASEASYREYDQAAKINDALKRYKIVLLGEGIFPVGSGIYLSSLQTSGEHSSDNVSKRLIGLGKGKTILQPFNRLYDAIHQRILEEADLPDEGRMEDGNCRAGSRAEIGNQTTVRHCGLILMEGNRTTLHGLTMNLKFSETLFCPYGYDVSKPDKCADLPDYNVPQTFSILVGRNISNNAGLFVSGRPTHRLLDSSRPPDRDVTISQVEIKMPDRTFGTKHDLYGLGVLGSMTHIRNVLVENFDCQAKNATTMCLTVNAPVTETYWAGGPSSGKFDTVRHADWIPWFTEDPHQGLVVRKSGGPQASCSFKGLYWFGLRISGQIQALIEGCSFAQGFSSAIHLYSNDTGIPMDSHLRGIRVYQDQIKYDPEIRKKVQPFIPAIGSGEKQTYLPEEIRWDLGALLHIVGRSINRNCYLNSTTDPKCAERSNSYFLKDTPSQVIVSDSLFEILGNSDRTDPESLNRVHISEGQGLTGKLIITNSKFVGGKLALRATENDIWYYRQGVTGLLRPDNQYETNCTPQLAKHTNEYILDKVVFQAQSYLSSGGSLHPIFVKPGALGSSLFLPPLTGAWPTNNDRKPAVQEGIPVSMRIR